MLKGKKRLQYWHGIAENPLINKMMINWAEKQRLKTKSKQLGRRIGPAGLRAKRNVESQGTAEQQDNLEVIASGDTMLRGNLDEAKETTSN